MRLVLMVVIFIFCEGLAAKEERALNTRAELVWVDSQANDHRLMFSQLTGDKWSAPIVVYRSEKFVTTPSISTDFNHNKLIIWSEQSNNDTVLMSSRRAPSDTIWQQAEKLNDFKAENLSPSIVVDSSGRHWVFWSSNYEGLDDIYYSHREGGEWSSPMRVHSTNDVPDIQPIASLDKDLNVVVAWKTYNLQARQYLTVQRVFTIDNSSKRRYKTSLSKDQQESISDMVMPSFLPMDSAVMLHFPNNHIEQSVRLDLNR